MNFRSVLGIINLIVAVAFVVALLTLFPSMIFVKKQYILETVVASSISCDKKVAELYSLMQESPMAAEYYAQAILKHSHTSAENMIRVVNNTGISKTDKEELKKKLIEHIIYLEATLGKEFRDSQRNYLSHSKK